jgi:hypothetical protein
MSTPKPAEPKCCECGAVIAEPEDFCEDTPEDTSEYTPEFAEAIRRCEDTPDINWDENRLCDQCACAYAGICNACKGPCRGLAWPKNVTHIWPRWPV